MQGTILLLDEISTNRIMLKVLLSSAFYHVVQADCVKDLQSLIQRTQPDLVVTAMNVSDGSVQDVLRVVRSGPLTCYTPVVAITSENDQQARLAALNAGANDVLTHPISDILLQARIRSLLRDRNDHNALHPVPQATGQCGLAEADATFLQPAHVALVTQTPARALHWRMRLSNHLAHRITTCQFKNISNVMTTKPDAVVVEMKDEAGPRLAAELCARGRSRDTVVLGVATGQDPYLVADAFDRGAHDVMQDGFDAEELAVRLRFQLRKKESTEKLRATVKKDLRAAHTDPLTGLYNRRFAIPHVANIAREAEDERSGYALMLADLDHFKKINDAHGHVAGDAILAEAARRMKDVLDEEDMMARIGGEEFLIAIPKIAAPLALSIADDLRNRVNGKGFHVVGHRKPIKMTVSIGLLCGPVSKIKNRDDAEIFRDLLDRADHALYAAKHRGRNRVSLVRNAA